MLVIHLFILLSFLQVAPTPFQEAGADALILYDIQADKLLNPQENSAAATTTELREIMQERDYHDLLWEDFTSLIPSEYRRSITKLAIFTDGEDELLASVTPNAADPNTWTLALDALDGTDFDDKLVHTLIHEFAHILFLSPQQVPRDLRVFNSDEVSVYDEAEADCPTFFTGEGCSVQAAYITTFFETFWQAIYEESLDLSEGDLYELYPEQFVSDYAATNPGEDIAESWAFYVLADEPLGDSIAAQKLRFFAAYPELVALKQKLLANLED